MSEDATNSIEPCQCGVVPKLSGKECRVLGCTSSYCRVKTQVVGESDREAIAAWNAAMRVRRLKAMK